MKSTRALTTLLLLIAATGIGCATSDGAPRRRACWSLMHVDVDNPRDDLVRYSVARKQGMDADCGAGPAGEAVRLRGGRTNPVNLVVPADQTACVASPSAHASLRWHARKSTNGVGSDTAQFLALGAHDR